VQQGTSDGIRFFGVNFVEEGFSNTLTSSSGTASVEYPTDNLRYTRWTSIAQGSDGISVFWNCVFSAPRTFNRLFINDTNISDISFQYGTGLTVLPNEVIVKGTGNTDLYIEFDEVTTTQIRVLGSNTLTAHQDKYLGEVYAMASIGQFEYPVELKGEKFKNQVVQKLDNGKKFVIDKGTVFRGKLSFKSHINKNDIEIYTNILERDNEFHVWPNGGSEGQFTYRFFPYRFKDIFKVSIIKSTKPSYTKNLFHTGLNATLDIEEVD